MKKFFQLLFALLIFSLLIWIIFKAGNIFLYLIIASILAYLLNPLVDFLEKAKFPRALAIITVYIELILVLGIIILIFLPSFLSELKETINLLPLQVDNLKIFILQWLSRHKQNYYVNLISRGVVEALNSATVFELVRSYKDFIFKLISSFFYFLFGLVIVLIITFYLLLSGRRLKKWFLKIFPLDLRQEIQELLTKINEKISKYILVQFFICLLVALWNILVLMVLGVNYAFIVGLVVGFASIIPVIGSIFGVIANLFFGLMNNFWKAIIATSAYLLIQFLTDNFITPQLIGRKIEIHPLVILLGVMICAKIFGPIGILIAVPILIVIKELIIFLRRKEFYYD